MTTDAERECYYRLAKEAADKGTIIELGAWMGASTAYIAAGVRDADEPKVGKVIVFDKFQSKPGHIRKVKEFYSKRGIDKAPVGPCLETFKANLGGLMHFVAPVPGQIEQTIKQTWADNSISLLVTDAPKRVPAISTVLTALRKALQPGAIMAWQDFCHFPSYEIPACLFRMRDHIEFVEAVVPGTTLVFRLKSQWTAEEVSLDALALSKWTPQEIGRAWAYWMTNGFVPAEKVSLFRCGAAMFMCDLGHGADAVNVLAGVYQDDATAIVKKWRYLKAQRPDFVGRYAPLFAYLEQEGVFEKELA
jgi:predicted O-methyltransferase YrrM